MRRQLNSEELADVVLIDSRTGLTEMGGVCTRQLADVVVSFAAPNIQNLMGVVRMAASFKKKDVLEARNRLEKAGATRPLEVVAVPTRIDQSENDLMLAFKAKFFEQLGDVPTPFRILRRTFWDLQIPYIPKYAYEEKLAIGDPMGSDVLQKAYKALAAHLVLLAPEGSALRANFSEELRNVFGRMSPRVLFLDDGRDVRLRLLREEVRRAGISVWGDDVEGAAESEAAAAPSPSIRNIALVEHLILPVTPETTRLQTFLRQWRYARKHGVCVQLVNAAPGTTLDGQDLPLWLRGVHIYDPERELDALIKALKSSCTASRVPFMAPELPDGYVERPAEIRQVVGALLGPSGATGGDTESAAAAGAGGREDVAGKAASATRVALCGPGGVGKTTISAAACHDERTFAAFGDGVLWVTLGETPDVESELTKLSVELTGETQHQTLASLTSVLSSKLEARNCLLVVDDVRRETDLRPFIEVMGGGAILFTTRDRRVAEAVEATQLIVGVMTPREASELLVASGGVEPGHAKSLDEVAQMLGRFPLALKLAGGALRERVASHTPAEEAVRGLAADIRARGVVAFDQKDAATPESSVARSIAAGMSLLNEEEKDDFLKLGKLSPETEIPIAHLKALWGADEAEAAATAKRLASISLLHFDEGRKTVRLPAYIQSFLSVQHADPAVLNARIENAETLFARLTPEEQAVARRILTRLVDFSTETRRGYDIARLGERARQFVPLLEGARLVTLELNTNNERTAARLADDALIRYWPRMREWLDKDRAFLTWRQSLELRVAEWESSRRHNLKALLVGRELAEARSWRNKHGDDLSALEALFIGESERAEAASRSRARKQAVAAVAALIVVLSGFGYSLYRAQRLRDEQREEALKVLTMTRGMEANPKAQTLGTQESQKESYNQAIEAYKKLLAENPHSAEVLNLLGDAYSGLGSYDPSAYDGAIKSYQQAIAANPESAEPYLDLGTVYKLKGDGGAPQFYDLAVAAYGDAIKRKPDYAEAFLGRADVYKAKGDRKDANAYDRAAADYTVILDQLNKPNPEVYYKRGSTYLAKGDKAAAVADFQKVLDLSDDAVLRLNAQNNIQALNVKQTPAAPAEPRIFIQYNDPNDELELMQLADDLRADDYKVIGRPQLSVGRPIGAGDVRCFYQEDYQKAQRIAEAVGTSLTNQGFPRTIKARPLSDYPGVPRGNIEVWIPSLRGKTVSPESETDRTTEPPDVNLPHR
jgi:tetratricopeptide (TPR) repeat protein